jgi:hypothetical protein
VHQCRSRRAAGACGSSRLAVWGWRERSGRRVRVDSGSTVRLVEAVSKLGGEAGVKPSCSALTQAGKPCRRQPVREDGLFDVHGGRVNVREAGRRGG